jgi:hypothetical protein
MADKIMFPRKCNKCGATLSEDEEKLCVLCEDDMNSVEQKQATEDKKRHWKRDSER